MIGKYELVGIANRLYEIWKDSGVYAYSVSSKAVQMEANTLAELFPDVKFIERSSDAFKDSLEYRTEFAGVTFFAICKPEEMSAAKAKAAEKMIK